MQLTPIEQALFDLFDNHDIGWEGFAVSNGADYYKCSSCYTRHDVMGHAGGIDHIAEHPHQPGCKLYACYTMLLDKMAA